MFIKEIFKNPQKKNVKLLGWVVANRGNNNIRFLKINDGSCFENIQIVIKDKEASKFDSIRIGAATPIQSHF